MLKKNKVLIYTDASFKNGHGGFSAIICYKGKRDLIIGRIPKYIDNSGAAEFYAVLKTLMYIRDNYKNIGVITFNSDHFGVVDTIKKYIRGEKPAGKKITIAIRKYIFLIAKNQNYYIQANHVGSHQKVSQVDISKTIDNLKKASKNQSISSFKLKKECLFNDMQYNILRRLGTNKSSILNNLADHHSRRARRKAERINLFHEKILLSG